ncbi:Dolichyl-diphosphooligosaccharide--protein glycosyltransferase subunit 1B [Camellia lanceoleosa]|uniref:Dolichyl-diphosphooligosaccharide--protein glycosyltransferase subunit 1B n=1 Tax=Camellia lanceoleosa TaxID=1840588 RepID=A0ACC0H0B6_9ERIC|nr:Dolichyl-diphosphooligosaccharide--protein glycosyltransferase subunit 1B [Camellia lanceoleosa]
MDYHCKTSFLSNLMVVDELTIKVVLPEGSKHPSAVVPFPLQQHLEGNFMNQKSPFQVNSRRMEPGYVKCFEKELSKADVNGNLEIPRSALYLPDVTEDNEIMLVWDHGNIWRFKAPVRRDGTGRRYMSCQWRQFAKDNSLMDRDVLEFYRSTAIANFYVVTFERALRALPLFPGAPL